MDYPKLVAIAHSNKVYRALSGYSSTDSNFRPLSKNAKKQVARIFSFFRTGDVLPYAEARLLIQMQLLQEKGLVMGDEGPPKSTFLKKHRKAVHIMIHHPNVDWVAGILPEQVLFEMKATELLIEEFFPQVVDAVLEQKLNEFNTLYEEVNNNSLMQRWCKRIIEEVYNNVAQLAKEMNNLGVSETLINEIERWLNCYLFIATILKVKWGIHDDKDLQVILAAALSFGFIYNEVEGFYHISDSDKVRAKEARSTFSIVSEGGE